MLAALPRAKEAGNFLLIGMSVAGEPPGTQSHAAVPIGDLPALVYRHALTGASWANGGMVARMDRDAY
jgi:hypothetical protein